MPLFIRLTPVIEENSETPDFCCVNVDTIGVLSPTPEGGTAILFSGDLDEVLRVQEDINKVLTMM